MTQAPPLKVWMFNRPDAYQVVGGDTIQMEKTAAALAAFDVQVETLLSDQLPEGRWDCQLVHVFNLQTPETSWEACQQAKRRGLPVVLSPIYWDPLPQWFAEAPEKRLLWNWVKRAGGDRVGWRLYRAWQRLRYPARPRWRQQRSILLAADAILPNSIAEGLQAAADFRLDSSARERFQVIPNAIDRRIFEPLPNPAPELKSRLARPAVMQVGRLAPEKNPLALLDALWDAPVDLVFVGPASPHHPEYVRSLRERASRRGGVHFLDWVDHEDLPRVYAAASVHALPSWRETPGLASLEAAAAGCRVVSTSVGSAREYLGDEAWYCRPDDHESIRAAVMSALQAPTTHRLRTRVLRDYCWEAAAHATFAVYKNLLDDSRQSVPAGKPARAFGMGACRDGVASPAP